MQTTALPLQYLPPSRPSSVLPSSSSSSSSSSYVGCGARRSGMEASGLDSAGREFSSASEMWREEIGENGEDRGKLTDWYSKGISYWQGVEASVEGVLGGYGCVNDSDIKGSEAFLKTILPLRFGIEKRHLVSLDCGSGIGRVTKNLLLRYFNEVDLVEPVSHFLETARENLSSDNNIMLEEDAHKASNFFCIPLQEFTPETGRYDVIWIQWCIGHLTDPDFISFFNRAKVGLKPNGFFIVKENVSRTGFVLDKEDQSITRSDSYFRDLFEQCGLYLHSTRDQKEMPKELFAVKMYCLVTEKPKNGTTAKKRKYKNNPSIIKS